MPIRTCALVFAAAASLGLAGCERGADSGATANPNAPGSPGTGNPTQVVTPVAPDSPPRGSEGVAGSAQGSSGGDAVPGMTSGGSVDRAPPPGGGLQGGMGAGPASMPAGTGTSATSAPGTVPDGSTRGETGQR